MNVNASIFGYVSASCSRPDKIKIEYYNRKFTESEFLSLSRRVGGYLSQTGYAGKVVGIMLPNIPEAVFALYGASAVGSTVNLLNPRLKSAALEKNLLKTDTRILFIYDNIYAEHRDMLDRIGVKAIVCSPLYYRREFYLAYLATSGLARGATRFSRVVACEECAPVVTDGSEVAVYIHSGGTTGESKTVEISSRALNSLADIVVRSVHPDPATIPADGGMLAMLPIFHGFGLGICIHTVINHIRVVLEPLFKAKEAAKLIKSKKITHLAGVPQMYRKLTAARGFKGAGLRHLTCIFCGGDRLDPEVKKNFDDIIRASGSTAEILEGYGLTETASVVTVNPIGGVKPLSQGLPLKGNRVRITDDNGIPVGVGVTGNIELAPLSLMEGYLGDEASSAVYSDDEGVRWLRTGDLGYLDADGYLYFKERVKRTVKIAAINVFPSEVEALVESMPEVKECCAVRRSDVNAKPYIRLYVRVADEHCSRSTLFNKIRAEVKTKIVRYAVPREIIEVTEPLVRTAFGKVDFKHYEQL